jgi:hypothetical protein
MPERSRKRPTDLNALAASIVSDATDEDKPDEELRSAVRPAGTLTPARSEPPTPQDAPVSR